MGSLLSFPLAFSVDNNVDKSVQLAAIWLFLKLIVKASHNPIEYVNLITI